MRFNGSMLVVAAALGALAGTAAAGPYTAGNLVVVSIGDGAAALSSAAAPVTLQEWNFGTSAFINPLALNSGATGTRLTLSGSATSEGALSLAGNGRSLVLGGYDALAGT